MSLSRIAISTPYIYIYIHTYYILLCTFVVVVVVVGRAAYWRPQSIVRLSARFRAWLPHTDRFSTIHSPTLYRQGRTPKTRDDTFGAIRNLDALSQRSLDDDTIVTRYTQTSAGVGLRSRRGKRRPLDSVMGRV